MLHLRRGLATNEAYIEMMQVICIGNRVVGSRIYMGLYLYQPFTLYKNRRTALSLAFYINTF